MNIDSLPNKKFKAMLFDMDGTLTNSVLMAEGPWARWAEKQGLDVKSFLPTIHGKRSIDTITALNLPNIDPAVEAQKITEEEIKETNGITEIAGAGELLRALPQDRWAVVTSAPLALAKARLIAAGLPLPRVIISAESVKAGKPSPDCYLLGAKQLGVNIEDCLVFEDVEAGIMAGVSAGAQVVVVTATHEKLKYTEYPSIKDYSEAKDFLLSKLI
jgi:sugar-phosphatase